MYFSGRFLFVVGATIYIGYSNNKQKSYRGKIVQYGMTFSWTYVESEGMIVCLLKSICMVHTVRAMRMQKVILTWL